MNKKVIYIYIYIYDNHEIKPLFAILLLVKSMIFIFSYYFNLNIFYHWSYKIKLKDLHISSLTCYCGDWFLSAGDGVVKRISIILTHACFDKVIMNSLPISSILSCFNLKEMIGTEMIRSLN